jgi:sedoheptulokinase
MSIIGIDIGTTSICGIAIDESNGDVIKSIEKNSNAFIDTDREWEKIQSVEKIITLAENILAELLSDDTKAIGVTGQMHGILYLDENNAPASSLFTWQDLRGNEKFENGMTYAEYLTETTNYKAATGFGLTTHFYNFKNKLIPKRAKRISTIQVSALSFGSLPTARRSDAKAMFS